MEIRDVLRNELSVKFTTDNCVEIISEDFSGKRVRTLTFDEFAECILASRNEVISKTKDYVYSEVLPNNNGVETIGVVSSKTTDSVIYVLKKKPKDINIAYYEDKFKIKSLPTMLMAVKVVNGRTTNAWLCCAKDWRITKDTKIYRFPLSNVFSDSSICWGSNRITEIEYQHHSDISRLISMFLSMPFNDHNYNGANKSKLSFRKLAEYLTENDFNEDWLKDTNLTYHEWLKGSVG